MLRPTLPIWCALALAVSPAAAQTSPWHWEATNPGGGGYFMGIGAGPSGIMVACSDLSGPYLSRDRGESWQAVGPDRGITNTHAGTVAFHATNPAIIYVGSGSGLFRSEDLGQTFVKVIPDGSIEHVVVAPSNDRVVFAAWHGAYNTLSAEIRRSHDGGTTWQRVDVDLPGGLRVLKLLMVPNSSNTIYAMTGKGRFVPTSGPRTLFRSDDGGAHWTDLGASFNNLVTDVALDPFDPDGIYLSTDDAATFHLGHLYRSYDRGATWTYLDQRGGFIWPHRQNPQVVRTIQSRYQYPWLPGDGIWESTARGAAGTWVQKSPVTAWTGGWSTAYWAFNGSNNHDAVAEDLSDPETLLWAGSQFAYATFDGGQTAQQVFSQPSGSSPTGWRSRGLDNVVVVDLAVNDANPSEIYAAFWDLGTWCSLDGGASWVPRNDPAYTGNWGTAGGNTFTLETDPDRPGVVWATQSAGHNNATVLLRSQDTGATWPVVATGLPGSSGPHFLGLSLDRGSPSTNRTLYITAAGDVYGSTDDGVSWQLRLANGGLHFTAVDHHNSSIVYAGGQAGLWRSTASGAPGTWSEVGTPAMRGTVSGQPTAFNWVGVHGIAPDPTIPGRVYVAVHGSGKGLFRSPDNGLTWEPRLLADNHLRTVAVDPGNPNLVLVGSSSAWQAGGYATDSHGVWMSTDAGANWSPQNDCLTWPFASAIAFGPPNSGIAVVGSPGTGIHRRTTRSLRTTGGHLSAATGGSLPFTLDAGSTHAFEGYLLAASLSGTSPGLTLAPGIVLPLNPDPVMTRSLLRANTPLFTNTLGVLDASGSGQASFNVNPNTLTPMIGEQLSFAFMTVNPLGFTSNAATVLITP